MNWNAYTVCSVISGAVLIITGLARGVSTKGRVYAFIGGIFFCSYGIYAAEQTSGTFYFPIWIFIIPVVAIGYLVATALGANRSRPASHARGATATKAPDGSGAAPTFAAGPVPPSVAQMPPESPAAWAPPPPPPRSAGPFSPEV